MKKIILITSLSLCFLPLQVNAFPDNIAPGGFGGYNPGIIGPGAFGAYEIQLLKDQKQREMMKEDFEIYQKKKALDAKKGSESVINEVEDVELDGNNDTFIKKIKNKSRSNPNFIQNNGQVIIKKNEIPANAIEIKTPKNENIQTEEFKSQDENISKEEFQREAESTGGVTVKPAEMIKIYSEESPAPQVSKDQPQDVKPVSVNKPSAKSKPWLDTDLTNIPVIQPEYDDVEF